jgi:hypothetical protein
MDTKELIAWIEAHPVASTVIGAGGLIAILWLLGFFSSSTATASQDPLAAAYYAAEANQAVVAGQIQQATITSAAQTAQTGLQANAAVAINAAQAGAATTINGQNASAATTINQSSNDAAVAINAAQTTAATTLGVNDSNNQLLATYSNNATAITTNASNNATAAAIDQSNNYTSELNKYIGTIMAPQLARTGGYGTFSLPGLGTWGANTGAPPSIVGLEELGYTPAQASYLALGQPPVPPANP